MQNGFGSGSLWGIDSATNPTPSRFGVLQDISVDFAFTNKELTGTYSYPIAVGRGTAKINGKAKFAQLQGRPLNALFFNNTKATGQTSVAQDELGTITAAAVTVANSGTFVEDLGVRYSVTGIPLVRVASAPAAGSYTVSAGVYSFNASENTTVVKIDYEYSIAGAGEKITITNPLIGVAPTFKGVFTQLFNSVRQTLTLNANVSSKLSVASKLEDFMMPEFDWSGFADSGNNVGTWSLGEAS
jgi:hypothetical protein